MENTVLPPKKIETTIIARCAHCKQELYVESFVDQNVDGHLVEQAHDVTGSPDRIVCPCRTEEGDSNSCR